MFSCQPVSLSIYIDFCQRFLIRINSEFECLLTEYHNFNCNPNLE